MTGWHKMDMEGGKTFEFQPLSIEGKYTFSIWDNKEKKYLRQGDSITTAAGNQEVNSRIKLTVDEAKRYRKSNKFVRDVMFDGEDKKVSIAVTADRALRREMDIINQLGEEPLSYTYMMKKEGSGLQTKYFVSRGRSVGLKTAAKPSMDLGLKSSITLSADEQAYINALKDTASNPQVAGYSKQDKIDLLVQKLKISVDRSSKIIGENF
ncbi:hypothetical protein LCGC14_2444420 [marine sediment metagenome]|uniref:Uncharacterized protein n=1 Tax=marine sediment metagenome TaxID=412755 RepID=A0A0F9DV33_9ZZZZ